MNGHIAYIAMGANLGAREQTLREALKLLAANQYVQVLKVSSFLETKAVGGPPNQPNYLNAAASLETTLSPRQLLDLLLEIERKLGRVRSTPERNQPRTIDLDVLLFDDRVINEPELVVPHPRMHERKFVLKPLSEIAPDLKHPILGKCTAELLSAVSLC